MRWYRYVVNWSSAGPAGDGRRPSSARPRTSGWHSPGRSDWRGKAWLIAAGGVLAAGGLGSGSSARAWRRGGAGPRPACRASTSAPCASSRGGGSRPARPRPRASSAGARAPRSPRVRRRSGGSPRRTSGRASATFADRSRGLRRRALSRGAREVGASRARPALPVSLARRSGSDDRQLRVRDSRHLTRPVPRARLGPPYRSPRRSADHRGDEAVVGGARRLRSAPAERPRASCRRARETPRERETAVARRSDHRRRAGARRHAGFSTGAAETGGRAEGGDDRRTALARPALDDRGDHAADHLARLRDALHVRQGL